MSNINQHAAVNIVAGVVMQQHGKILLVQEGKPHVRGKWNLPGGRVDHGESIEAAAVREAKEETGFEVELEQALPLVHEAADQPVLHPFSARIIGGELKIQEGEILDAKWLSPSEIRAMPAAELRVADYILGALDALGL